MTKKRWLVTKVCGLAAFLVNGYLFCGAVGGLYDSGILRDEYTNPNVPDSFWVTDAMWLAVVLAGLLCVVALAVIIKRSVSFTLLIGMVALCVGLFVFCGTVRAKYEEYAFIVRTSSQQNKSETEPLGSVSLFT